MFKKFIARGIWWLPENPANRLHGTLTYDPIEGALLEVVGSFEPITKVNEVQEFVIINGLAGSEITIYKCFMKETQIQFPGTVLSTYFGNIVFKGHLFKKESEINFNRAQVEYNYLTSWINRSAINITTPDNKEGWNIFTKTLDSYIANIGDNLKIILTFPVVGNLKHITPEIFLKQKAFFKIETKNFENFENFFEILSKIEKFLTLAINEPIQLQEFNIFFLDPEHGNKKKIIEVLLTMKKEFSKEEISKHPSQMPFSLDIIANRFDSILNNWFYKSTDLDSIFNLYFALRYSPDMYVENKFLNLIQFLEAYHRRKFEGKYLSDMNYEKFTKQMIESIPEIDDENYKDFKETYIYSFKYGNELKLRKRLKLIYEDNESISNKFIPNNRKFIDMVVNTRNYLVHLDKTLEKSAILDTLRLVDINIKLKILVELCILNELGFEKGEIETIFSRNDEYRQLMAEMERAVPVLR